MKLKYRFLKIFLLVILLGFLMNFATQRHNNRKVEDINIEIGNSDKVHFITDNKITDIVNRASKNGLKASKIKDLDIIKTENYLTANPFISNGNVFVNLNGKVSITVTQKVPVARVKSSKEEFYLDKEGNRFPLSPDFSYPCMLVNGNNIKSEEYSNIAKLCNLISVDNLLKTHVIAIKKEIENSYNLLLNIEGVYIEYGALENNRQKLTNLKEFYKQYLDFVGFDAYRKISLKYDNQIVATKR